MTRVIRLTFVKATYKWEEVGAYDGAKIETRADSGLTRAQTAILRIERPDPETGGALDVAGRKAYGYVEMDAVTKMTAFHGRPSVIGFVNVGYADFDPRQPKHPEFDTHGGPWLLEEWITVADR